MNRLVQRAVGVAASLGVMAAVGVGISGAAYAHGYIDGDGLIARAALKENTDLGPVQYEPQSLEAPKGFPEAGPPDGQIASAGGKFGGNLDEQSSTRWVKNVITAGPHTFDWVLTADHKTESWTYWITKNGWDPNAPLARSEFQQIGYVDGKGLPASSNPRQTIDIPADHTGYNVILAIWNIADTGNAFYNTIDVDITGTPTPDTQAPTAPGQPTATYVTDTSATIQWPAATDNVGVASYQVLRDGQPVTTTSATSYTDSGLTPSTAYQYTVTASDAAGNVSAASEPLTVTTNDPQPIDTQAPTAPTGVHSMGTTSTGVDLMWSPSQDNVGVAGYTIERGPAGGTLSDVATTTDTSYQDTGLTPATSYDYRVVAFDAAGNTAESAVFTVTTPAGSTYPAWNAMGAYNKGDRVSYQGENYICVQGYTGAGDPNWINALSLWQRL